MLHRGIPLAVALFGLSGWPAWSATQTSWQITTAAGSDLVGDGGLAGAAQLAQPEGLALDAAGNLYIADAANHRIRCITPAGLITTVAGNGHSGFSGDNGPASAAQLSQPYGLAFDAAGNLYIADLGNQRVRRITPDGLIATFVGNGESGSNGDGGPATAAQMLSPRNLAFDPAGNLYISEFGGHRVRRVSPGGVISTVAGTGILGYGGDGGPATSAQMDSPAGIALDSNGALYIVDTGNANIRKVQNGIIGTILDKQQLTTAMGSLLLSGLAADSAGDLYIPNSALAYSSIWRLNPSGALTMVAGAPGANVSTADGSLAVNTAITGAVDLMLNAGNLYISEYRRVRLVNAATRVVSTVAGDGTFGYIGDGASALQAVLNAPAGLALDSAGNLYIADQGNGRVRQVNSAGLISTVAGGGQGPTIGDGLPATSAILASPCALLFDAAANLDIAECGYSGLIRQVQPSGMIVTIAGDDAATGYGADGTPATLMPLLDPHGLALDALNNLYIADTQHQRIVAVNAAGIANTVAGNGTPGFDGDGSGAPKELNAPTGLALDSSGNLYIADTGNHRIRMLSSGGSLSTVAGSGVQGFGGDGGPATAALLSYPSAIAIDSNGNLFIADTGNDRVRLVTPDGNIATIAGTGFPAFNGETGPAQQIALHGPAGLALDAQGNLWVADTGNHRVRVLSANHIVVPPPQIVTVSVASAASLQPGPLAPGEIFSIFGSGIGPDTPSAGSFDASGLLTTTLAGVQVTLNNIPAPIFYAQSQQINAQVPYELAGQSDAQLQVIYQGIAVASAQVPLADANPAFFTANYGTGNAAVLNQDGSFNSHQNPAAHGSIVVFYATGEGQTTPAGSTGQAAQGPYPAPLLPAALTIDGTLANILWIGEAPGFVGLLQINARIPGGFLPGGDLPVVLTIGSYTSPPGVTIAIE